ncbi:hypothetical protein CHS0354_029481 [Potamilus streckersoni]|uniref:DUF3011 domain-containing protein n=1 Tax=Potamilus streckersoni TaxID=2493646 RepID=A0AAE0VQ96_9BIVA|nr:hypothetical protein CHS0354_029481 [Potamilus streckersoni]
MSWKRLIPGASLSLGIRVELGSLSKDGEQTGGLLIKKPIFQTEPSEKDKHLFTNQETNKGGKAITTNECVNTVEVMCKSCQGRFAECPVFAAKKILKADPVHIFDNSPCIEGKTWGVSRERVVWVDQYCVAKFKICFETFGGNNALNYEDVECQSDGSNNKSYCKASRLISQLEVLMRFDTKRCVRDKTFGFEGTQIWVSKGCWAKFRVYFLK